MSSLESSRLPATANYPEKEMGHRLPLWFVPAGAWIGVGEDHASERLFDIAPQWGQHVPVSFIKVFTIEDALRTGICDVSADKLLGATPVVVPDD
jgi:hypothetical protein